MKWKVIGMRVLRSAIAVIIAGLAVKYGESDWYLAIAPLLIGVDKLVRWEN